MLRHPQSKFVVFHGIRGKVGCYFIAIYHSSTVLCIIISAQNSPNTHENITK